MTNGKTLNKQQAKSFAYAIIGQVPNYISTHTQEYLAYLKATGQQALDHYYSKQITEADK